MSGRNSTWWRGFWAQTLAGGDTMVNVRLLDGRLQDMVADLSQCEREREEMRHACISRDQMHGETTARWEKEAEEWDAERKRLRDALGEYGVHQLPCLLAQWHEGRPRTDGGYETRYGDRWYQRGDTPPCTCGLDAALSQSKEEEHGKIS